MTDLLQFLVAGLSQGSIYALVAIGFTVIYRATNIVNFSQGDFVMLGGLGTAGVIAMGLPPLPAAGVAFAVAIAAALLLDRVIVSIARHATAILLIIVTIGASVTLRGAAQLVWGRNFYSIPTVVPDTPLQVGGVAIMPQMLVIMAATLLLVLLIEGFFRRTRLGKGMIAAAINPMAASLVGIELRTVFLAAFLIAGGLGAIAGVLITPLSLIQFESGLAFGLKGFAAAVLGGLGSVPGAMAGGLVLGVAEALGAGYVSSAYKDAIAYVLLVVVLLARPQGLFGQLTAARV
jgi:branched-chain amino acid transport system permease protein